MEINQGFFTGLGVTLAIAIVVFFNRLKKMVLYIFGGELDKTEFAGIILLGTLLWMLHKEGNRQYEWHLFSELHVFIVAGGALTGLGLTTVLDHIRELKNAGTNTTSREVVITEKKTKTEPTDSEEVK